MSCTDTCLYMGDHESGEFCREATPRAAKPHACCECGSVIAKGEVHHYASGKWDGEFMDFRTCAPCHEIRLVFACEEGWAFTLLWETMDEQMFPEWDEIKAIDCLARLKTDAAIAKVRERYNEWNRRTKLRRRRSPNREGR